MLKIWFKNKRKGKTEGKKVIVCMDTITVSLSTNYEILPQAVRHDCVKFRYLKCLSF